ncbi:MAG: hypothetical protein JXB26_19900 [Candidatus Aminicenantes bacterium]|nr:hypothetical protein [Candidatus Aminicenantes bacterium]
MKKSLFSTLLVFVCVFMVFSHNLSWANIFNIQAEVKEVKGFPGVPLYPGAESIAGTEMGDTEWTLEKLKEEGYIWYEFSKNLCQEYNEDPQGVDGRIIDFYKKKLGGTGWTYIGEGVRTQHWAKENKAIGVSFPADCSIKYEHMSVEEAKGNCGELDEDGLLNAYVACAQKAQEFCKENGISSPEDYMNRMADEQSYESFKKKMEACLNAGLKPFGVTLSRFREIKEKSNYDEIMGRLYSEQQEKITSLQLGFMILGDILE